MNSGKNKMRLPSTRYDVTGLTILQLSKDEGHGAKDKPRDGAFQLLNVISFSLRPMAILSPSDLVVLFS